MVVLLPEAQVHSEAASQSGCLLYTVDMCFVLLVLYMFVRAYHIPEIQNFGVKVQEIVIVSVGKKIQDIIETF
jgi:hypothetical protein